jgi:hypothetical protein
MKKAALLVAAATVASPSAAVADTLAGDGGAVSVVLEGLLDDKVKLPVREAELLLS